MKPHQVCLLLFTLMVLFVLAVIIWPETLAADDVRRYGIQYTRKMMGLFCGFLIAFGATTVFLMRKEERDKHLCELIEDPAWERAFDKAPERISYKNRRWFKEQFRIEHKVPDETGTRNQN